MATLRHDSPTYLYVRRRHKEHENLSKALVVYVQYDKGSVASAHSNRIDCQAIDVWPWPPNPAIYFCLLSCHPVKEVIVSWNVFDGTGSSGKPTSDDEWSSESGSLTNVSNVKLECLLANSKLTAEAPVSQPEEFRRWIERNVASWTLWIVVRA